MNLYTITLLIHGVLAGIAFFQRYNHPDVELEVYFGELSNKDLPGIEGNSTTEASTSESLEPNPLYLVLIDLMRFYSFVALAEAFIALFSALFIKNLDSRLLVARLMCLWMLVIHGGSLFVILNPVSDALESTSRTTSLVSMVSSTTTVFLGLYLFVWNRLSKQKSEDSIASKTVGTISTTSTSSTSSVTSPSSSSTSTSISTLESKKKKKR